LSPAGMIEEEPPVGMVRGRGEAARRWSRFRRNPLAMLGLVILVLLVALAVLAPVIAPYSISEMDRGTEMAPPFTGGHLLGTDLLGRDLFTRVIYSLRT